MTRLPECHEVLLGRIRNEFNLVKDQLRRSFEAREANVGSVSITNNNNNNNNNTINSKGNINVDDERHKKHYSSGSNSRLPSPSPSPAETNGMRRKEGTLRHLVRGAFGGEKFVPHFIVVDEYEGIMWFQSEAQYRSAPLNPLGRIPFWKETRNSRGSRFKSAAVCWPLILPEDCAKATDPTLSYFAIEYLNESNSHAKIVLAAVSEAERNEWVFFITQFIDLYLAPRAESEELQSLPRGALIPKHRSEVIEGEAPGGSAV